MSTEHGGVQRDSDSSERSSQLWTPLQRSFSGMHFNPSAQANWSGVQMKECCGSCASILDWWLSEMTPKVCFCGDQVCFFPMRRCSLSGGLLFGAIGANPVVSLGLLEMLFETSSPPRLSVATPLSWTPLRRRIRIKESWNLTKYAIITTVLHSQKPGWKWNVVCLMKVYRKKGSLFDFELLILNPKTKSWTGALPFEFDWIGQRQVLDWEACKAKENR